MDFEIIDIIFTFGNFAALTPPSPTNHNPHCLQKLHEICVFLVYIVAFLAFTYVNSPEYHFLTSIQFVLAILCDLIEFFYVF
jgi:hypothetical protein